MIIQFSKPAERQAKKLPLNIKKKFKKQISILRENPDYPSLRVKKMGGGVLYEARIDNKYRFRFDWKGDILEVISVGVHDVGLGKK